MYYLKLNAIRKQALRRNWRVSKEVDERFSRVLDLSKERGSRACLAILPIQSVEYFLTKQKLSYCLDTAGMDQRLRYCQCWKDHASTMLSIASQVDIFP